MALLVGFLPGSVKNLLLVQGRFHDQGHFLVFLLLGAVLNRTGGSDRIRLGMLFAALLLGFVAEFGEHVAYNMTVEWRDVAVNVDGAAAGALLAESWGRWRASRGN